MILDYTSDTDDNVKRWDMSNINTSWKRYQVVAATFQTKLLGWCQQREKIDWHHPREVPAEGEN